MAPSPAPGHPIQLRTAVVVAVTEEGCATSSPGSQTWVRFAPGFPSPRVERVSPGHLVAIASTSDHPAPNVEPSDSFAPPVDAPESDAAVERTAIVWRWFDVVVLGESPRGSVIVWEPGHGEVEAHPTEQYVPREPGSRAYASAGLGDDGWQVTGPVVSDPGRAQVDLDDLRALYDDNDLWGSVFGGSAP
jgi:hypothetical protein